MTGYNCVISTAYGLDEMYSADVSAEAKVVKTKEEAVQYLQERYDDLLYEAGVEKGDDDCYISFDKENLNFDLNLFDGAQRHYGYAEKFTL